MKQRFEHMTIVPVIKNIDLELKKAEQDGWELVAVSTYMNSACYLFFKRPVEAK